VLVPLPEHREVDDAVDVRAAVTEEQRRPVRLSAGLHGSRFRRWFVRLGLLGGGCSGHVRHRTSIGHLSVGQSNVIIVITLRQSPTVARLPVLLTTRFSPARCSLEEGVAEHVRPH
jgi:hypothetical protein